MQSQIRTLVLAAAVTIALGSTAFAAPAAKQYQSTLTSPTNVTGSTITITKPSKLIVKISTGNVTFQLKLSGVENIVGSTPADVAGNNLQVDVIIANSLFTLNYPFDIVAGKTNLKATTANSGLPGGGVSVGEPIEIRAVRLIQGSPNFSVFAVAGLTAK